jgi:hypothetical protein
MKNSSGKLAAIRINPFRVIIGGMLLFLAANLVFALIDPPLVSLTLINKVLPGFRRFPVPRVAQEKNGVSIVTGEFIANLDILLSSHIIAGKEKPRDEYRIVLVGDSTVWGSPLELNQTLTEQINQAQLAACDGRQIVAYNLGYPGVSAIKDLIILSETTTNHHPDLVVWFFSLSTLVPERTRDIGFSVENNERLRVIEQATGYDFGSEKHLPAQTSLLDRTLYGRRAELAFLLRLYMFDLKSLSIRTDYLGTQNDMEFVQGHAGNEGDFLGFGPGDNIDDLLDVDFLLAADKISGFAPVVFINEPMYIEENNPVRYNQVYPRWVYDQYRILLDRISRERSWIYVDLWNALLPNEFVDTVFHRTFEGETRVTRALIPVIQAEACKK